jgi:hypothetical protein
MGYNISYRHKFTTKMPIGIAVPKVKARKRKKKAWVEKRDWRNGQHKMHRLECNGFISLEGRILEGLAA